MKDLQDNQNLSRTPKADSGIIPAESQGGEPVPLTNQEFITSIKKVSLQKRLLKMAIAATGISSLVVIALDFLISDNNLGEGSTALPLLKISLVALLAGAASGLTVFILGQRTATEIKQATDDLKSQLHTVAQGDFNARATVSSPDELVELATSFNQMTLELHKMFSQVQQKAEEQEKLNENLQTQLSQLHSELELATEEALNVDLEVEIVEQDDKLSVMKGTLLDFIDHIQNKLQAPKTSVVSSTSSTMKEIQKQKEELQYRSKWLEALLNETQLEMKFISEVFEAQEDFSSK